MILLTGSTGKLGSAIIENLLKKGMTSSDFAGFARNEEKAQSLRQKGVTVLTGDYEDYDSLIKAMKGVDILMMISGSDIEKRIKQHENIISAAKASNVKHVLYTSFHRMNDESGSPIAGIADAHIKAEILIKNTGLKYTFFRNALYAEVVPMFMGENAIASGIYFPADNGKVPYVLRADLAEAIANVLIKATDENKIYSMVNTVNYSFYDIARMLSVITGRNVTYTSPSEDQYVKVLSNAGLPDKVINAMLSWSRGIKEGYLESEHSDLEMLLGRKPQELESFLIKNYGNHTIDR